MDAVYGKNAPENSNLTKDDFLGIDFSADNNNIGRQGFKQMRNSSHLSSMQRISIHGVKNNNGTNTLNSNAPQFLILTRCVLDYIKLMMPCSYQFEKILIKDLKRVNMARLKQQ
jgi:hypothetical protein